MKGHKQFHFTYLPHILSLTYGDKQKLDVNTQLDLNISINLTGDFNE